MKDYIEKRAKEVGNYILSTKSTIRKTAKVFGVSKSTIHKDVERLSEINPQMVTGIKNILANNFKEKYLYGGLATKMKYKTLN